MEERSPERTRLCYKKLFLKKPSALRSTSRPTPETPLSKVLEKQPKVLNSRALNCSGKGITKIDPLALVFTGIESLNISKNHLESLTGVSQFPRLKFLDISHNFIKELNEFLHLKDLKSLEVLICEGNPINKSPVFEDTIIAIVGGLKTFNNRSISIEDKTQCRKRLSAQTFLLEKLLENYCELVRLQSILNRLRVHEGLRRIDGCFQRNLQRNFNISLLRKYCPFSENLDWETVENMRKDLIEDVEVLKSEFEKNDQEAETEEIYEVLMEKQKEKINELKANIDEKIAFLKSETPINNRTNDEIKISNFLNKSQIMPKKQGNSSEIPVVLAKEIHKKELIFNTANNHTNNKANNPNNRSQLLPNNSRDSSMINPQKNLGKLLNNSTNMVSPMKRYVNEKDKLLNDLTNELREKIEEISRISEINSKFKQKLKEFQEQNEQNVRLFQEESLTQSIKYKNLLENNKALQEEQAKNSEKINELLLKNYSLNKAQANNQDSELKLEVLRKKLENQQKIEENTEHFLEKKQEILLKTHFFAWKSLFYRLKQLKPGLSRFIREKASKTLEFYFNQLQKYYFIRKIISAKNEEKSFNLQQNFFKAWKRSFLIAKKNGKNREKHEKRLVIIAMVYWKNYMQLLRKKSNLKRKSLEIRAKLVKKRYFPIWFAKYRYWNMPMQKLREMTRKAENFSSFSMKKRVFSIISRFYYEVALPNKRNKIKSELFHLKSLKTSSFSHWKSIISLRKSQDRSALAFLKVKTRNFLSKILENWRLNSIFSRKKAQKTLKMTTWFIKSRYYKTWRKGFLMVRKEREQGTVIERNFKRKIMWKVMNSLKKNRYLERRMRKIREFYERKREDLLRKRVFEAIRLILKRKRSKCLKLEKARKLRIRRFFTRFASVCFLLKVRRNQNKLAIKFREKSRQKLTETAFIFMRNIWFSARRLRNEKFKISKLITENHGKRLNFKAFQAIKNNFLNGIKEKFNEIFEKNKVFSHEIQARNTQIDEILLENHSISEELKKNQRKIAEFQENSLEQAKNENSLKNILDKSQAQLKDLLSENQEKTRQLRDLSARNEELSQSLENLNKSLEKRYKDSILENDQISLIIQNLKREISDKEKALQAQGQLSSERDEDNRRVIRALEAKIEGFLEKLAVYEAKIIGLKDFQRENEELLEKNRGLMRQLDEMKNLEYRLKMLSQKDQENSKVFGLPEKQREKSVHVLDSLNREIEDLKLNRNNLKENIELRLKTLSQNIDSDFSRTKPAYF